MNRPHPKWKRILAALLGRSFNTSEASRELGTSCLHSDIAGLELRGLRFDHIPETIPGFGGVPTRVVRYRLRPESFATAHELLGLPAVSRPAAGLNDAAREYARASRG
jgi:hypothetical protein